MVDIYLDAVHGDDAAPNDGTYQYPWKTIGKAISSLANPVVGGATIHLAGSLTTPDAYDYGLLALQGIQTLNNAALSFWPCLYSDASQSSPPTPRPQPQEFDAQSYAAGNDPFAAPRAPLDVLAGVRPCQFSQGAVAFGCNNVAIAAVKLAGAVPLPIRGFVPTVLVNGATVKFSYCEFVGTPATPTSVGLLAGPDAEVSVENSWWSAFNTGALVMTASLALAGDNWLNDCGAVGLRAYGGRIAFQPWFDCVATFRTTTIQTTYPRAAYKAVWATASQIVIPDLSMIGVPYRGQVQIIKADLHGNDEYYGVVLEAQSLLLGRKLVMFTSPTLATTQPAFDTVPTARQFSLKDGEGCVLAD